MNAFAREVDPHTSYLSPRNAEQFQSEMNLVGRDWCRNTNDRRLHHHPNIGCRWSCGVEQTIGEGDRIIGVGQEGEDVVDVVGWRLDDVVQLIKGPKGSKVKLLVLPEGKDAKSHVITIVRDKINLEDRAVKSEVIEKQGRKLVY